jgi:hypothetical protein
MVESTSQLFPIDRKGARMPLNNTEALPTTESIASYVKKNLPKTKMMAMHGHMESVREVDYKGHHIVVRTMYEIAVDGRPVTGHIDLSNEGQVAYHGLPNMSFDSAVELVESLIDHFPGDFSSSTPTGEGAPHNMSGMAGGSVSGMAGASPAGRKKAAAKPASKPGKRSQAPRKRES